jgi:DNA-binding response OmpR family regulator
VIFMTARARARDLDRFIAMGAVDVIAKPFDPMTLAAKVRDCIATVDPLDTVLSAFLLRIAKNLTDLSKLRLLLEVGPLSDPTPNQSNWNQ